MAIKTSSGPTAFEQLREHYDQHGRKCFACGFEDEGGTWNVKTTGREVRYQHRCPACDALETHVVRLGRPRLTVSPG
ncbi:MAG: HVO_0649 family zinc finger protein [Halobacteriota archaeon]